MIRYYEDIDITSRNSFHVRQVAKRLVEFDRAEELPEIFAKYGTEDWYVLSGGNNILFTKDIDALLITPCDNRIEIISESDTTVRVKVGAGVEWDTLVAWSVEHNLWGIENLSLIPGKAGAAPVQNIGACLRTYIVCNTCSIKYLLKDQAHNECTAEYRKFKLRIPLLHSHTQRVAQKCHQQDKCKVESKGLY